MRFTVITPSYLGDYSGAAKDRADKLHRCLNSLNMQMFTDCEFIIVSDGCAQTTDIMKGQYPRLLEHRNFKLIELEKQELHSGRIRQAGMDIAQGEYIVFVDSDDFVGIDFLYLLDKALKLHKDPDMGYYNVLRFGGLMQSGTRTILRTKMQEDHVGNGMITFKRSLGASYEGFNGYKHDWKFIQHIRSKTKNIKELPTMEYYVCHIPGVIDV